MSYLIKVAKGIKTQKKEKKITKERRNVFIIDDSMIKGLAERGIARDHNMKVRPQPGWTTQNIEDHIKSILHKNTDAIIIHLRMINQKKKESKKGSQADWRYESWYSSFIIRIDTPRVFWGKR